MAGGFLSNLKDKSLDGIAGLNSTIEQKTQSKKLTTEQEKIFHEMGLQCYQLYLNNALQIPQFEALCARLKNIENQLNSLQNPASSQAAKTCSCGTDVPLDAKFCPNCGFNFVSVQQPIPQPTQICVCGAPIHQGQAICMQCGRKAAIEPAAAVTAVSAAAKPTCTCGVEIQVGQIICLECGRLLS